MIRNKLKNRMNIGKVEKYYGWWGPAAEDGRVIDSELKGNTFWWQENINSGFLEGTCSTSLCSTETYSISVVETGMGKGREESNWSVNMGVWNILKKSNISRNKYFLNTGS